MWHIMNWRIMPNLIVISLFLYFRMDSFVLAETFKYLYLLFSEESEHVIDVHNFIFTTEAHLLPLYLSLTPAPTNTTNNTTSKVSCHYFSGYQFVFMINSWMLVLVKIPLGLLKSWILFINAFWQFLVYCLRKKTFIKTKNSLHA